MGWSRSPPPLALGDFVDGEIERAGDGDLMQRFLRLALRLRLGRPHLELAGRKSTNAIPVSGSDR